MTRAYPGRVRSEAATQGPVPLDGHAPAGLAM